MEREGRQGIYTVCYHRQMEFMIVCGFLKTCIVFTQISIIFLSCMMFDNLTTA